MRGQVTAPPCRGLCAVAGFLVRPRHSTPQSRHCAETRELSDDPHQQPHCQGARCLPPTPSPSSPGTWELHAAAARPQRLGVARGRCRLTPGASATRRTTRCTAGHSLPMQIQEGGGPLHPLLVTTRSRRWEDSVDTTMEGEGGRSGNVDEVRGLPWHPQLPPRRQAEKKAKCNSPGCRCRPAGGLPHLRCVRGDRQLDLSC